MMMQHKLQAIQNSIIQQSGQDRLILNDLVFNRQAVELLATLLPNYHKNIRHIEIKGNNIDSHGFQIIFTALLHCSYLKSLEAQWNNIGGGDMTIGFQALLHLTRKLHYLEYIDLKNNRITHTLTPFLCQIIQADKTSLRVIDLRWNDIGQIGGRNILKSLPYNKHLNFIGLEDNRISTGMLAEIEGNIRQNQSNNEINGRILNHSKPAQFSINVDEYESMDSQIKNGELRTKIDHEQKQVSIYVQKIEVDIQKQLQKIKLKGTQINQMQTKYQTMQLEHHRILDQLKEAQRVLILQKQRIFGMQRGLNEEKSRMRTQKYKLNTSIQTVMEKYTQRNQRQLEEIDLVMGQKLDRINIFLKERLHEKHSNRQKLSELKEDIMKMKLNKQQAWNKGSSIIAVSIKSTCEEQLFALGELINKSKSSLNSEAKKGEQIANQMKNIILRALKKEDKLEDQIYGCQNTIKKIHNEMAIKNLQSQALMTKIKLKQSKQLDYESSIQMLRKYLKYIQSQNNIAVQIQNMRYEQLKKGEQISDDSISIRIQDLERALRAQQAQNKLIRNQYDKLLVLIEANAKKTIQSVLFD